MLEELDPEEVLLALPPVLLATLTAPSLPDVWEPEDPDPEPVPVAVAAEPVDETGREMADGVEDGYWTALAQYASLEERAPPWRLSLGHTLKQLCIVY